MSEGTSRFRTGHVSAPRSAAERVRLHIGDGERLLEVSSSELEALVRDGDDPGVLEVLAVVREHDDTHRVYAIHKGAAHLLQQASALHRDGFAWARYYDTMIAALVPLLERDPHEPELLNQLGLAFYELGETPTARRLFEAVREIEPEHVQARANLKGVKERQKRGTGTPKIHGELTRSADTLRGNAKRIAERAAKLPDMRVSLCMIVKDESEMLPGCLEAAAKWVDELIIVDTGSTDDTRAIAESHGATVIDFPWTGSFSEARNRSIADATGDWILYLDADEHLVDDDGKFLRELARKSWIEGIYLVETNFTGELEVGHQTTHMAMRMFRRRPNYQWTGIIHEQKLQNFPTYLPERFQYSPIRVNHYGYLKQVIEDRSKRERNLDLLMQQAAGGTDAFTEFNIGSELGAMGDWASARPHFEQALTLSQEEAGWQGQQFSPLMVVRSVIARRGTGDNDAALALIAEALTWWPDFTDLVFERAVIAYSIGDHDAARREAELAISMGDAPAKYVAVGGKGSYQARGILAMAARLQGDLDTARDQLERALAEAPEYLPTLLELADVLLETEPPDDVARRIDADLDAKGGPTAHLLLATSFYERGHLEQAEEYYERTLAAAPTNPPAIIGLAELRLAQHRFDDAIDVAGRIDRLDPMATRAARTEILAAVVAKQPARIDEPLRRITEAGHLPHGERAFYAAWAARVRGDSAVLTPDPDAAQLILDNLEALAKLEAADEFEVLVPMLDQALPDNRLRHLQLGNLYLRRRFPDMAGEEYLAMAQEFGPDPQSLTGLGKVATMKEMWDDAEVFLGESLHLDPNQPDAQKLLQLIQTRRNENNLQ